MSELIHELEVRQVELEVQNEELRRAHDQLAQARNHYRDLYEFAPVGYLTVDQAGEVLRANLAAARLCGRERSSIIGKRLERLVARDDRDACYVLLRDAGSDEPRSGEVRLDRPDGKAMRARMEVAVRDDETTDDMYRVTLTDITARSHAEQQLARQRELLQRVVDTIPILLVMWDPRMERFTLNRHATEVLGWTSEDANNGDFMKKVYPDPAYRAEVENYMASLSSDWRELRTTARSGEQVPIDWANVRLTDDTMVGIGVDLRERKAAEQAIRLSEERYRLAAWAAQLGAYSRDLQTGEDYWSPEFKRILGLQPDDEVELKDSIPACIHPDDRERVLDEARNRKNHREEARFTTEHRINRPDGQLRWVLVRGLMEYDDAGRPARTHGFAMDITEQKWAQRALRESEERFRALVRSSAQTVWETTPEGLVIKDSPSWREFTGQHLEESLAEGWVNAIHPADREHALDVWNSALGSGEPLEVEYRLQRPDGTYRWTVVRAAPIHGADGQIVKWVGMNVDITDRKQTELALREAREELEKTVDERTAELRRTVREMETAVARQELAEQVLRERNEALFELNRELETRADQLQSLTLQCSLAEDRERHRLSEILHDELQQMLVAAQFQLDALAPQASVKHSVARGFEEISSILSQAIAQTRDLSHQLHPVVLHQRGLIAALEWLAEDMQERHSLEIDLSLAEDAAPRCEQLTSFLFKAARELLFNVVKHSGVRQASLSLCRQGDYVELQVSDNGDGFDPPEIELGGNGSGLGLLSIRERAEFLGGTVHVESIKGDGSRFTLRLPREEDTDSSLGA
ncbi:MAG: PAS domain S-box protein [Phycisphaerae bacterium]